MSKPPIICAIICPANCLFETVDPFKNSFRFFLLWHQSYIHIYVKIDFTNFFHFFADNIFSPYQNHQLLVPLFVPPVALFKKWIHSNFGFSPLTSIIHKHTYYRKFVCWHLLNVYWKASNFFFKTCHKYFSGESWSLFS